MSSEIENKWQEAWRKNKIFEPEIDDAKQKFFITVPWPYTNGALHVGHGRTYALADMIARYKRSRNYNVLYPMAFHQSGTPILAFSERIRMKDRQTLDLYRSYLSEYVPEDEIEAKLREFEEPKNIADYFSNVVVNDFSSLGYSMDWTRRFTSADPVFQDFVRWQFRNLEKLGLIKNGEYPILYSIKDENAVGEDDIKDGDIDKVSIEEFTAIKFKGPEFSLVASSLRPETIFGITNLWIGKEITYVLCDFKGEKIVVSKESFEKLKLQHEQVDFVREISSREILDSKFIVPITEKSLNVFEASFVNPDNGSGIVYSVPGHSVWDYVAIEALGLDLEPIDIISMPKGNGCTVRSVVKKYGIKSLSSSIEITEATQELYREEFYNGSMTDNSGGYSGMSVQKAREKIRGDLVSNGNAFIFYETSRKAETRGGSKVIVAVLKDQWFIDYSVEWWKEKSHELINSMFFYPPFYKNAMNDIVDWLKERPCARRRGLGTRLPFNKNWIIESLSDSTIYPAVYTNINQIREIYDELGTLPDEIIEYVYRDGDEKVLSKYSESVATRAKDAKRNFDYWYGVDIRLTALPHISNHLTFYLMNHSALFSGDKLPKGLIITGLVLSGGAKISKSKGNVISLLTMTRKYSADIYRLYIAVQSDISSSMDWSETDLSSVIKKYDGFKSIMESFDPDSKVKESTINGWFVSRFYQHYSEYLESMDSYNVRTAFISIFYEVINDLKHLEQRGGDINSAIKPVLRDWLLALSPVIPHICEEYWHRFVQNSFVSLELQDADLSGKIDRTVIEAENYVTKIIEDVREIMKATGIDPRMIEIEAAGKDHIDLSKKLIANDTKSVPEKQRKLIPEFMKNRKNITIQDFDEIDLLKKNSEYLRSSFGKELIIRKSELRPGEKNAWPGRPLINLVP